MKEEESYIVTFIGEFFSVVYKVNAASKIRAKAKAEILLFQEHPLFTIKATKIEKIEIKE